MSTTDQRTGDAEAPVADRGRWAVPGVAPGPIASEPTAQSDPVSAEETAEVVDVLAELDGLTGSPEAGATAPGPGAAHPVVAALATCLEALEGVRSVSASTLTAREIRLMLLAVAHIVAAVFAVKMKLLVAGETQRVADLAGATSTAAFLSHLTQSSRPDASAQVRMAQDLQDRYQLLGEALAQGLVSPEQTRVCVNALRKLPKDLTGEQVEACQRFLIDAAQSLAADKLKRVGRRLWEVIDPDAADAEDEKALQDDEDLARAQAYFRSWRNGDGTTGFRGKLPDVQADILIKVIQAYAAPRRRANPNIPTGQPDDTSHADVDAGGAGKGDTGDTRTSGTGDTGPADGAAANCGVGDGAEGVVSPEERETGRSIPYPVRLGHGLMDLIEHLPAEAIPFSGGMPATIVVTMTVDQLRGGLGVAALDTGTQTTAAQARRMACEAGIIPLVLGGESQPLDIGREQRCHTRYQRIAMGARDQKCTAHGCDRPTAWTHAHHLDSWASGGRTSVERGVMVCPYHHTLLHHPDWTATLTDRVLHFRRRP